MEVFGIGLGFMNVMILGVDLLEDNNIMLKKRKNDFVECLR
jgi:hypothetical protein